MIELDGTSNKSRLGANAILGVSCAVARAVANSRGIALWRYFAEDRRAALPVPMVNILSGGLSGELAVCHDGRAARCSRLKSLLMLGEVDRTVAATIGRMLAAIVRASWRDPESERVFGDQSVFDQLRIDPYYRTTAARHLEVKPYFDRLMRDSGARRVSLVHGDC